jgi:hypothetical protein
MGQEDVSLDEVAQKLRAVIAANGEEIEDAIAARMRNSGLDIPELNVEGLVGLRPSAKESLNMMVESFEQGDAWEPALPPALAAQIRYAARNGAPLEVIMRGIGIVGNAFLELVFQKLDDREAKVVLQYMAAWQSRNADKVTNAFITEYTEELERLNRSPTHDRREQVGKLLDGAPANTDDLDYRLDLCHIGLIAVGEKVDLISRRLAEKLGCDLLIVPDAERTFWVWLGAPRQLDFYDLEREVSGLADSLTISAGEPREGPGGWRLSHLEAESAAPVALIEGPGLVRHSNVALLAGALCHEEISRSLIDRYLKPLERHRDAVDLRKTLRVYFESRCNAASTASALGVNRHTVLRRLKRVEESIGEPSSVRHAEFSVALRLEQLTARPLAPV